MFSVFPARAHGSGKIILRSGYQAEAFHWAHLVATSLGSAPVQQHLLDAIGIGDSEAGGTLYSRTGCARTAVGGSVGGGSQDPISGPAYPLGPWFSLP